MASFSALLRSMRLAAGLTQEELAERAGLTSHGVSALERGVRTRPHSHTVRALGDALGLSGPQRDLFLRAARPGIGTDSAAMAATAAVPVPATAMVGREQELADLMALLASGVRLLTVTGTGGVGKTRLVIEAARVAAESFPDGVSFVALAPVSDPALVMPTLAAALGVTAPRSGTAVPDVAAHLGDRRVLIVLDNFEHVVPAAPSIAEVLDACPSTTLLVSSRARLRLRAEVELALQPLSLPLTEAAAVEELRRSAAYRLLAERVRAVGAGSALTAANATSLSELCRRLGGIPLAIELAAPKVRTMGPDLLLERLDEAHVWEGARDLPERQQTMAATLAWSYGLLTHEERALFRRLSVFAGGFDLEAAESVGGDQIGLRRVLGALESLVEQSLVVVTPSLGGVRYTLLEPVRQYGHLQLQQVGDEKGAHLAHAAYFLDLARRAEHEFNREDQLEWLERTGRETDNFQTAVAWSLKAGESDTAVGIAWALRLHWWMRGLLAQVGSWMDEAMTRELSASGRTRAMLTKAKMAHGQGDFDCALQVSDEATQHATHHGDLEAAVHGRTLHGLVALDAGQVAEALEGLRGAVALAGDVKDELAVELATVWLASVMLAEGDEESAGPMLDQAMRSARRRGDRLMMNEILLNRASAALQRGQDTGAAQFFRDSAALSLQLQDRPNLAFALEGLAVVESRRRAWERCAVLLGAAEGQRSAVGGRYYNYYVPDRALVMSAQELARSALSAPEFEVLRAHGAAMDPSTAERYATT